jgi:GNAT superfamily N-acetyltransferase
MIEVSVLQTRELPELAAFWTRTLAQQGGSCGLMPSELQDRILLHGGEPRTILAIDPRGWLVARDDGKLAGFAHCTVGRLPQDDPEDLRGFLRALVVSAGTSQAVVRMLLRAANNYFRVQNDLINVIAFHPHTGYPYLDDGRGTLRHGQWVLMDALGEAGFRLARRWLFYFREYTDPIPEQLPRLPALQLRWEDSTDDELALSVWSGPDRVASARFLILPRPDNCDNPRTASLYHLTVEPDIRRQGVGQWLLVRAANHLYTRGISRLLVDAPHEDALFHERLRRLGFHEQPLRGYTYEKHHA